MIITIINLFIQISFANQYHIDSLCNKYEFSNCLLVESIIHTESRGNPLTYNPEKSGSYGLMQIQLSTARHLGLRYSKEQLFDPEINIRFGIKLLKRIQKRYSKLKDIIAAWNAGSVRKCKDYNEFVWGGKLFYCYPGEYINQGYVIKVMRHYSYLKRLHMIIPYRLSYNSVKGGNYVY